MLHFVMSYMRQNNKHVKAQLLSRGTCMRFLQSFLQTRSSVNNLNLNTIFEIKDL